MEAQAKKASEEGQARYDAIKAEFDVKVEELAIVNETVSQLHQEILEKDKQIQRTNDLLQRSDLIHQELQKVLHDK